MTDENCPYCGYFDPEAIQDVPLDDSWHEIKCDSCGKTFKIRRWVEQAMETLQDFNQGV